MIDLMFFICGILLIGSYLFRDMLTLRLITLVAMIFNITGGLLIGFHAPGMTSLISFSLIIFLVNLYKAIKTMLERVPVSLSGEIKDIYLKSFKTMTTHEFFKLYKYSTLKKFKKGDILATQSQPVGSIMLIKSGYVNIIKNGSKIAILDSGFFIGEMSFFSGEMAAATVEAESNEIEVLIWDKIKLKQLKKHDFNLYDKLDLALAVNLIKKINRQN